MFVSKMHIKSFKVVKEKPTEDRVFVWHRMLAFDPSCINNYIYFIYNSSKSNHGNYILIRLPFYIGVQCTLKIYLQTKKKKFTNNK